MRLLTVAFWLPCIHSLAARVDDAPNPCTIRSPSGLSYDLNPMAIVPHADGTFKEGERNTSWTARGYDYGSNFTLNFCAPVVEELDNVYGVDRKLWGNVSAFYTRGSRTYSLGQLSTEPVFRGRKFVLNYTDGSPCSEGALSKDYFNAAAGNSTPRKSSIISLLCDRDTVDATKPKVGVSLVGWGPDECTYFFEARSQYACGGLVTEPQSVGPGSVFGIIMLIALAVYVLFGIAYQRIVMHQRGWRQFPNYAIWAGFLGFFSVCLSPALKLC